MGQFFGGSPHGKVDLISLDSTLEELLKYQLLVLPGWNTMTDEIRAKEFLMGMCANKSSIFFENRVLRTSTCGERRK